MEEMSFAEFRKTLLACVYKELEKEGFDRTLELSAMAERVGLRFKRGWLRKATETFETNGWAKVYWSLGSGSDGGMTVILTGAGIEKAEQFYEEGWAQFDRSSVDTVPAVSLEALIPASDRVVTLTDNVHAAELRAALEALEPQLASNNELPATDAVEFERRFAEFHAGNLLVKAATASAGALATVLLGTLGWLLAKLAETAIAPLLTSAIVALRALLGLPPA